MSTDDETLQTALDAHVRRLFELEGRNVSSTARRLGIYRSMLKRYLRRLDLGPGPAAVDVVA